MAHELVSEVLDHAPDMTPAERLILVCIAEQARTKSRAQGIPSEDLRRRACLDARGMRHALNRLAERGLDVRVVLRTDRHGKPVYAVPGRVTCFYLPHFLEIPAGCACHRCSKADPEDLLPEKEDEDVRQEDAQVRQADFRGTAGGPTGPPLPSGETEGLSPDHGLKPAVLTLVPDYHHPYDRKQLMADLERGKRRWRSPPTKPGGPR